jgi:trans-2,3-dihydro-3-hydroxyanthranilate isomerase
MAEFAFETVDVFTDTRFGGNPLAVFPDATGLTDAQMQAIAREFNFAETTFVLPPADPAHTARVRIFTPAHEMPFAGHPNVGTGFVLASREKTLGDTLIFEEIAGLVQVRIQRTGPDVTGAEIDAPLSLTLADTVPGETVAACLGLGEDDVREETHAPVVASVGVPFVLAELSSRAALARIEPDIAAFREAARAFPDLGGRFSLFLYVRDESEPLRLHARMFGPLLGVPEDPATGSANATLAALLTSLAPGEDVSLAFDVTQGEDMGRPSRILASARKTAAGEVFASVAGGCVPVTRGTLTV